ncbi:phosphatidylinositol/phosphatidylcholine transfer protein SFH4 [Cajanus cajan]|uniref:Sec14 cytosolic factor n=1 Tax=Cajanus cajan TaxID=3821 RepID=A0A151SUT2_CAJCA|nr:phosphatidylinositol/phosphatidylcholine transfer protein SFH4 [Cajanus cajan]XP_020224730.1 phosphatidylinositol/phosphatidylcholine transfer protein SFH4 [Cajanus cajan]KYP58555.1 Sec14 cytosolic factor [Cajanus cajan]
MGVMVDNSDLSKIHKPSSVVTENKAYKYLLIASHPKSSVQRNYGHFISLIHGRFGSCSVGRIIFFLLKVAALEIIRRFSKTRCPCVWRGLQALQILCYPPFKWIQGWAPFKGLVENMQVLSRPLLALSIATLFSDQSKCSDGKSDCSTDSQDAVAYSELSPLQVDLNTSQCLTDPKILESEKWLIHLNQELENQGLSLPERINDDELRRFYAASNEEFSCFLTSIKKTIRWRETYRILSEEELKIWSKMVFWHGSDVRHRPCLIVRLGLACNMLTSEDRPRFAQAVISQVEYGVLHLVDSNNPQITVFVDCEGLSPVRIPTQIMRSCSSLLQDHFPNRLGSLFVIRLPAFVHVIAQTFIRDLKPATKNKLKIEGERYQKALSDHLPKLPSYLGGCCTCMKCSNIDKWDMLQPYASGTSRRDGVEDTSDSDNEDSPSLPPSNELEGCLYGNYDQLLRTAIVGFLIIWVFIALGAVVLDPSNFY